MSGGAAGLGGQAGTPKRVVITAVLAMEYAMVLAHSYSLAVPPPLPFRRHGRVGRLSRHPYGTHSQWHNTYCACSFTWSQRSSCYSQSISVCVRSVRRYPTRPTPATIMSVTMSHLLSTTTH
jgi:hypothetical protein